MLPVGKGNIQCFQPTAKDYILKSDHEIDTNSYRKDTTACSVN